jgi:small subunit ribosomal protein S7e
MFPLSPSDLGQSGWAPWDEKREYYTQNLVVYVETRGQRLLKCGKDLPLTEVLAKAVKLDNGKVVDGVALKDGLMSFIVLPKGGVEKKWIEEYKKSRDGL